MVRSLVVVVVLPLHYTTYHDEATVQVVTATTTTLTAPYHDITARLDVDRLGRKRPNRPSN